MTRLSRAASTTFFVTAFEIIVPALAVPLLVNNIGQRFAGLRMLRAAAACLLIWIAEGDCGAHKAFRRDAEDFFGSRFSAPPEPADARTDSVCCRGKHDSLAQSSLVEGLLLKLTALTCHHQHDSQRGSSQVPCVTFKRS